ncbi:MAG: hypothetical protein GX561_07795 [Lentisphaerae bacterium]|jgi:hypothetical protein|nr:hypothetical protein [Lentisphaerota bacterium]
MFHGIRRCLFALGMVVGILSIGAEKVLVNGMCREPEFVRGGKSIVYRWDLKNGDSELHSVDVASSSVTKLGVEGTSPLDLGDADCFLYLDVSVLPDVFLYDFNTGTSRKLPLPEPPAGRPFVVGKDRIAYWAGFEVPSRLIVFDWRQGKEVELPMQVPDETVLLSPDLTLAVVQVFTNQVSNLKVIELKSGKVLYETSAKSQNLQVNGCHSPAFSPDGKRMAFVWGDIQPVADIHMLDLKTLKAENITKNGADNQNPRFSSDGTKLAYTTGPGGNYQLMIRD